VTGDARFLDHDTLDSLRGHRAAWRLLRAEHAPLILSFLHRVFVVPNARAIAQPELTRFGADTVKPLSAPASLPV
jgi:hypothetical protein